MTTTAYTLATVEDETGTTHPAEILWIPTVTDAMKAGFIDHRGLILTGVGEEEEPPTEFVALGHGHTWTSIYRAAASYMQSAWGWHDLHSRPGEEPSTNPGRTPLPQSRHAVFLRHPNPDQPCGCEWDGTWRLVYVDGDEPGAVAVTVMRHPAVTK